MSFYNYVVRLTLIIGELLLFSSSRELEDRVWALCWVFGKRFSGRGDSLISISLEVELGSSMLGRGELEIGITVGVGEKVKFPSLVGPIVGGELLI